jgi:hypothetical protein
LDVLGVDGIRKREVADERSVSPPNAVETLLILVLLEFPVAAQGQSAILDFDFDVVHVHVGQVGFDKNVAHRS